MIPTAPRSKPNDVELNIKHTQALLDRMERHEWWRWGVALVVMLALTLGLFALSLPAGARRDWLEQTELNTGLRALLGLVLLFDVFVVYQQILISRLRRNLATQLRVVTTLETLRKADDAAGPQRERRRMRRSGLDRRVRVDTFHDGETISFHGRIKDISEVGMGAVVPCSLAVNEEVALEFSMNDGHNGTASAIVRHRQGFHYGFDFVGVESSLAQAIARIDHLPVE